MIKKNYSDLMCKIFLKLDEKYHIDKFQSLSHDVDSYDQRWNYIK